MDPIEQELNESPEDSSRNIAPEVIAPEVIAPEVIEPEDVSPDAIALEKEFREICATTIARCRTKRSEGKVVEPFSEFVQSCVDYHGKPAHTLAEIRAQNNTRIRGDLFEEFCRRYLMAFRGYDHAWLLTSTPHDILRNLRLMGGGRARKPQDLGIDIIAVRYARAVSYEEVPNRAVPPRRIDHVSPQYSAVQAKYRAPNKRKQKTVLGWKQLSTFYALAGVTGPYEKHIVMTSADSVRHPAGTRKAGVDVSICRGTFSKLKIEDFEKLSDASYDTARNYSFVMRPETQRPSTYGGVEAKASAKTPAKAKAPAKAKSPANVGSPTPNVEEVRAARLARFSDVPRESVPD